MIYEVSVFKFLDKSDDSTLFQKHKTIERK